MDLPVFFYIDPDYTNDPDLEYTDSLILSYTFFESKPGTFSHSSLGTSMIREKKIFFGLIFLFIY